jgi:hypothetical protein
MAAGPERNLAAIGAERELGEDERTGTDKPPR